MSNTVHQVAQRYVDDMKLSGRLKSRGKSKPPAPAVMRAQHKSKRFPQRLFIAFIQ